MGVGKWLCIARAIWIVSCSFTEAPGSCNLELWAGAEDGARFVRRLVGQLGIRPERLEDPAVGQRVGDLLGRALELAGRLQQSDLVEAYLPTRFGAGAT